MSAYNLKLPTRTFILTLLLIKNTFGLAHQNLILAKNNVKEKEMFILLKLISPLKVGP